MESVGPIADLPLHLTPDPNRTVAAIVVVTEPSIELASTLRSLGRQDVPVTTLVVDDGSLNDPREVIAESSPDTFVTRLDKSVGWAAAANAGAALVQGATWLLITHDDVAPAPDAVREMLDVAIEHDADLVSPKLVSWNDHDRLLSVGYSADRSASAVARVDLNELDQGQHDFVRSVQAADGACLLVKASSFRAVGGFTECMTAPATVDSVSNRSGNIDEQNSKRAAILGGPSLGEDLDLCWRLLRAGGRAFVAPSARVAHAERNHRAADAAETIESVGTTDALQVVARRRNQVTTVISTLRGFALIRALSALIVQRLTLARSPLPLPAVRRLLARTGFKALLAHRQSTSAVNKLPHAQSSRFESQLVTGEITVRKLLGREVVKDSAQALSIAGDAVSVGWRRGPIRLISGLFLVAVTALLVGSRSLFGGVPFHGQFAPIPGFRSLLQTYGNNAPPQFPTVPGGRGVPGLLIGAVTRFVGLGQDGFVGFLSTTLLVPIGVIGAARLGSALAKAGANQGSRDHATGVLSASLAAALYGATPAAVAALRSGSWEALLLYGTLPWLLYSILFHGGELLQHESGSRHFTKSRAQLLTSAIRVGLPLAAAGAVAPVVLPVVVCGVILLGFGALIAGRLDTNSPTALISELDTQTGQTLPPLAVGESRRSRLGALKVLLGALIVCALLYAGWLTSLVSAPLLLRGRGATTSPVQLIDVLRFATVTNRDGTLGVGGWLTLGIPLSALITMLLVNELRLRWALRWWMVAIGFATAMWCAERGALIGLFPSHEVLAVPLSLAMVMVVTIGISAVTQDIRSAKFGWRQTATLTAIAAVILAVIPLVWSARSGTWGAKPGDARVESAWIADSAQTTDRFATLWVGTNETVDGQSFATKQRGLLTPLGLQARWTITGVVPPTATALWGGGPQDESEDVAGLLEQAASGATFRVGSLIPYVRYVVIAPPDGGSADELRELDRLADGLNQQLDLRETERRGSVSILENTAYVASTSNQSNSNQSNSNQSNSNQSWTLLRWLQLLLWSGATVAFVADWSTRRRRLDQLAAEFDDLPDEDDDDSPSAWDASLTVAGAFGSDDDVFADTNRRSGRATGRTVGRTVGRTERNVRIDRLAAPIGGEAVAENEPLQTEPESLADQLWADWSQRHGRDQTQDSSRQNSPQADTPQSKGPNT
jgi:GT2 family glycosyltransferase